MILERFGLHRAELRAWVAYDWANSVFMTTVVQVFPIYFARVAATGMAPAAATARFATATTLSMVAIALLSPLLGALADYAGLKKRMLATFMGLGATATAGLMLVGPGDWLLGACLFVLGNIGVTGSFVFYDSLLPHVARPEEVDRVSATGFSLGYLGGGLLLALNMLMMARPAWFGIADASAAVRISFLSAGIWWAVFSLPLLRWVAEPQPRLEAHERAGGPALGAAFARLGGTLREIRRHPQAFLFLLAFLVYSDGISTIIRMATAYGTEIGIAPEALLGAVLMVQFVGVPCALLFGALAARIGPRPAIFLGLGAYVGIAGVGYFVRTAGHFFLLAALIGIVMGGTQALSRSLFASLIPRHKSSEYFAFFGVFDKFAGVLGPALFAASVGLFGSSRPALLGLVVFFVVGGALLARVDVAEGRRAARAAEPPGMGAPASG